LNESTKFEDYLFPSEALDFVKNIVTITLNSKADTGCEKQKHAVRRQPQLPIRRNVTINRFCNHGAAIAATEASSLYSLSPAIHALGHTTSATRAFHGIAFMASSSS
jgi:hypothetical protein